jgi:hypothetical protein
MQLQWSSYDRTWFSKPCKQEILILIFNAFAGNSTQTTQVRRFCLGLYSIFSSGQNMLVIFKSDDNVEKKGFKFNYFTVPKYPPTYSTTTQPNKGDGKK